MFCPLFEILSVLNLPSYFQRPNLYRFHGSDVKPLKLLSHEVKITKIQTCNLFTHCGGGLVAFCKNVAKNHNFNFWNMPMNGKFVSNLFQISFLPNENKKIQFVPFSILFYFLKHLKGIKSVPNNSWILKTDIFF